MHMRTRTPLYDGTQVGASDVPGSFCWTSVAYSLPCVPIPFTSGSPPRCFHFCVDCWVDGTSSYHSWLRHVLIRIHEKRPCQIGCWDFGGRVRGGIDRAFYFPLFEHTHSWEISGITSECPEGADFRVLGSCRFFPSCLHPCQLSHVMTRLDTVCPWAKRFIRPFGRRAQCKSNIPPSLHIQQFVGLCPWTECGLPISF